MELPSPTFLKGPARAGAGQRWPHPVGGRPTQGRALVARCRGWALLVAKVPSGLRGRRQQPLHSPSALPVLPAPPSLPPSLLCSLPPAVRPLLLCPASPQPRLQHLKGQKRTRGAPTGGGTGLRVQGWLPHGPAVRGDPAAGTRAVSGATDQLRPQGLHAPGPRPSPQEAG